MSASTWRTMTNDDLVRIEMAVTRGKGLDAHDSKLLLDQLRSNATVSVRMTKTANDAADILERLHKLITDMIRENMQHPEDVVLVNAATILAMLGRRV